MSMAEPLSEKPTCASCGSEMAPSARLCHVCGSETKQWKNSLTYFAKIAGAIAIVASGATFMAGQAAIWYDRLMWQDAVQAVFFEYPGVSGFLNIGSGDVVLESVFIEQPGERDSITIPVNRLVHKGEFVPFDATNPFGSQRTTTLAYGPRAATVAPRQSFCCTRSTGATRTAALSVISTTPIMWSSSGLPRSIYRKSSSSRLPRRT